MTSPPPGIPLRVSRFHRGYSVAAVDDLVQRVTALLDVAPTAEPISADQLRTITVPAERGGYDETEVDAVIDQLISLLPPSAEREPAAEIPARGADLLMAHISEAWRNPSFPTSARRSGYDTGEVDALIDRLKAVFALTDVSDRAAVGRILDGLRSTTLHTMRGGYEPQSVDTWWSAVETLLAAGSR